MPLDNTAKITDIISTLQSITGINQKADFKSVLTIKGLSILDTDGIADMISKLSSSKMNMTNKRWASGSASISAFTVPNNSTGSISVSTSLSFTPSTIIIYPLIYTANNSLYTLYFNGTISNKTTMNLEYGYPVLTTITSLSSTGFTIALQTSGNSLVINGQAQSVNWIAFE